MYFFPRGTFFDHQINEDVITRQSAEEVPETCSLRLLQFDARDTLTALHRIARS